MIVFESIGEQMVSERILIVEDDKDLLSSLSLGTKMRGYQVFGAQNGLAALEILAREPIDLVVTDMRMPDMNGVEMLEHIREEEAARQSKASVPVILITGFADYDAVVRALRLGASDYLSKPFALDEFYNVIQMHLKLKQLGQEQRSYNARLLDAVKQRTQDLLDSNYKLRQLTEAKNEFVGFVSHELKNPLNTIIGYVQLIEKLLKNPEPGRQMGEYLSHVSSEAERMLHMVNDLLKLQTMESSRVPLRLEAGDIVQVAEKVVANFRVTHPKTPLRLACSGKQIMVEMDAEKIEEVFINLIDNAIKYSAPGAGVDLFVKDQGRSVEVRVCDSGPGIPPDYLEKIFEPFFRGHRNQEGFGLGLMICRSIVHAHQGKMWVESELANGSNFVIQLPKDQNQLLI
jgi:signal transduction histidine kinase